MPVKQNAPAGDQPAAGGTVRDDDDDHRATNPGDAHIADPIGQGNMPRRRPSGGARHEQT
jgi:hypothetical protein